ncbi:MAG: LLM class F420-dependent oxidoreductase [Steroidobacteraceae bacterium]
MQIGVAYPQTEMKGDPQAVRQIGLAVEQMGFDYLLAYDHVVGASHDREPKLQYGYNERSTFHDPLMMFAYLAGLTTRLEFATGVLILPQRQTVLVAKQTTDLDLLSGQRLRLGVGIGWNYVEYDALGQDFKTRGKRIDEQIVFLRRLWSEPLLSFEGEFDRIDRANINVRPQRLIPIWIGGDSEAAFRRGAKLGDGFQFAGPDVEPMFEKWAQTQRYLLEAGRIPSSFGREFLHNGRGTAQEVADSLLRWRDAGGTHGSFATMQRRFHGAEAHLDFIREVRAKLER